MAQLIIKTHNGTEEFPLYKRLTTIGSKGDIFIDLAKEKDIIAYISQTPDGFFLINIDDKEKSYKLNHNDTFCLKGINFIFKEHDNESKISDKEKLHAYKKLVDFSLHIAKEKNIDTLLATLLKEITNIVNAEYGFLVLIENKEAIIKTKHYKENKKNKVNADTMSDSIVQRVLSQKKALIINDAINDAEFSLMHSVINFRLNSIMCAPLIYQGELLGAIYVANNAFSHAFNDESLEVMSIFVSQAAMLVQNALHISNLTMETKKLKANLDMARFGGLIGACQGMQSVFLEIQKTSSSDVDALILGEAGSGKESIAREIHSRSERKNAPFVTFNCQAIAPHLLESELFGHVRGAFSGAFKTSFGKMQQAHNGILFLDEIDELPINLQIKLVEALKEEAICKIGDNKSEKINIKIIAATTKDLASLVSENKFRADLFYRLNIIQIKVPPLRERGNDVLVLAHYFLKKYAQVYGKNILGLDDHAKNALLNYYWPGNVRQLENRIKRAIVMCNSQKISREDLDLNDIDNTQTLSLSDAIDRFRKRYINESLERNQGNRTKTALELEVDPRTIFRHLESYKKVGEALDG